MTAQQPPDDGSPTREVVLVVTGMSCRHCVREVTAALRDVPGVETVEADRATGQVRLRGRFVLPDALNALARAGNRAQVRAGSVVTTPPEAALASLNPLPVEEKRT